MKKKFALLHQLTRYAETLISEYRTTKGYTVILFKSANSPGASYINAGFLKAIRRSSIFSLNHAITILLKLINTPKHQL